MNSCQIHPKPKLLTAQWRHWYRALRRGQGTIATLALASILLVLVTAGMDLRRQVEANMAFTLQRAEVVLKKLEAHRQAWLIQPYRDCNRALLHRLQMTDDAAPLVTGVAYVSGQTGFCSASSNANLTAYDVQALLATPVINNLHFLRKTGLHDDYLLAALRLKPGHLLVIQTHEDVLQEQLVPLRPYSGHVRYAGTELMSLGPNAEPDAPIRFSRQQGDLSVHIALSHRAYWQVVADWGRHLGPLLLLLTLLLPLARVQRRSYAGIHLEDVEQDLRRNRIRPVYQPVVNSDTGEIKGYEQLARWQSADLGAVSPDRFIGLLERHKKIGQLVEHLFHCGRPALGPEQYLGINVTPGALRNQRIIGQWRDFARAQGLQPSQVMLEITERDPSALEDPRVIEHLHQLKAAGFRIAFDDFGTGHNDLGLLTRFVPDVIKLDKEYVQADDRGLHRSMLQAIIALCQKEGIGLVAEGVETQAQRDWLRAEGVTQMQGYLFSRPMELASVSRDRPQSALCQAQQIFGGQFNLQAATPTGHE